MKQLIIILVLCTTVGFLQAQPKGTLMVASIEGKEIRTLNKNTTGLQDLTPFQSKKKVILDLPDLEIKEGYKGKQEWVMIFIPYRGKGENTEQDASLHTAQSYARVPEVTIASMHRYRPKEKLLSNEMLLAHIEKEDGIVLAFPMQENKKTKDLHIHLIEDLELEGMDDEDKKYRLLKKGTYPFEWSN